MRLRRRFTKFGEKAKARTDVTSRNGRLSIRMHVSEARTRPGVRITANQHHLHAVSRCVGVVVVAPVGRGATADLRGHYIAIFPKQHLLGITVCTADIALFVIAGVRGVAEIRRVIGSP